MWTYLDWEALQQSNFYQGEQQIQHVVTAVGQVPVDKPTRWQLTGTDPAPAVTIVATGLDGTTLPLVGEDYKEAMCGTIALYDKAGQRLTPAYLGTLPEAGKATCTRLFTCRVSAVLERYPKALHVVLADGASWNWQLLEAQYPAAVWILDFYHAAQHLATAADLLFGPAPCPHKAAWYERWRTALRDDQGGVAGVIRTLIYYRNGCA